MKKKGVTFSENYFIKEERSSRFEEDRKSEEELKATRRENNLRKRVNVAKKKKGPNGPRSLRREKTWFFSSFVSDRATGCSCSCSCSARPRVGLS